MRDFILLYINGRRHEIRGADVFLTVSDYLRLRCQLTGTKIVCAEGDCGACTVMRAFPEGEGFRFEGINSCISFVYLMDCSHLVTIEGIAEGDQLNPVQSALVESFGSQCGFCTPGFVMALMNLFEHHDRVDEKKVQNYLTGNLCRCTGYSAIIDAALKVPAKALRRIRDRYASPEIEVDLRAHATQAVELRDARRIFRAPVDLKQAAAIKARKALLVSAATDIGVQHNKGQLENRHPQAQSILSLNLIPRLYELKEEKGWISVGAKVSITRLLEFVEDRVPEFAEFLHIFASPQIKNLATLVGNIGNGSPIADTVPFLMVTEAKLTLLGTRGTREVPIETFYRGYRDLDLAPEELIESVRFQIPKGHLGLYKVSQRRDLDISAVNAAFLVEKDGERVKTARFAYGGVGPTVLRMRKAEKQFTSWDSAAVQRARAEIPQEMTPMTDARGSQAFRTEVSLRLFDRFFQERFSQKSGLSNRGPR